MFEIINRKKSRQQFPPFSHKNIWTFPTLKTVFLQQHKKNKKKSIKKKCCMHPPRMPLLTRSITFTFKAPVQSRMNCVLRCLCLVFPPCLSIVWPQDDNLSLLLTQWSKVGHLDNHGSMGKRKMNNIFSVLRCFDCFCLWIL